MQMFHLVGGAFLSKGKLYALHDPQAMDRKQSIWLASTYRAIGKTTLLSPHAFELRSPLDLNSGPISERGKLSVARLAGKSQPSHQQRLAAALLNHIQSVEDIADLNFEVENLPPTLEFLCEENKVRNYLLNKEHPIGGPKARFFADVLAIAREDWRYLANQLIQGMKTATLVRFKVTQQGVTHGAYVMITGRNGREAVVQTGWEIRKGKGARLVTAYPEDKFQGSSLVAGKALVVSLGLTGDERWKEIHRLASEHGDLAVMNTVPTPKLIEGLSPDFGGEAGFARIHIPDARRGFGRWLSQQNMGCRGDPSGRDIWVKLHPEVIRHGDSKSIELKMAYADAFSEVLRANGIACAADSTLDQRLSGPG